MNSSDQFIQWLLLASLRASLLALAVFALQHVLRPWLPARWRYALWLPVILVLAAPALPASRFSAANHFPTAAAPFTPSADATVARLPDSVPARTGSSNRGPRLLFIIWLIGAGTFAGLGGVCYRRRLRQIAGAAVPASAEVEDTVRQAAEQLGLKRPPRIVTSPTVESPAVTGLLRPVLLLPASFPQGFTPHEARLVLVHELTHLRRHDLPVNWLLCALQVFHWFNPVLWLAFARMRADRESACDAQVLGAEPDDCRAEYGHALLKFEGPAALSGFSLGFVGMFERAGLQARIRAIAAHRRSHPAWAVLVAAIIAVLTLAGATRAQQATPDKPKESAPPAGPVQATDQGDKGGRGKFMSFKAGTLTLKGNYGVLFWNNVPDKTQVSRWSDTAGAYQPAGGAEVLDKIEPGTWVMVSDNKTAIRLGSRKGRTKGTFISFKDDRLLILGIDIGESYVKKYGNQIHFNKFAADVPVYESIDGGDFVRVGTPATTLPKVKEGTIVTVYGEGDDNIVRIEIGVPKSK